MLDEFPIKRSFIEESFPVKEVSEHSAKEKNIRHGHISTLHIWWARRPLASSRATAYASLIPVSDNVEEMEKKKKFIAELSKWENSLNSSYIEKAREDIKNALGYTPKVLDPFAGGGAIPLEALRLGCETYASEYNPVANLVLEAVLEYPQKYGGNKSIESYSKEINENYENYNLVEDVKKWGQWVFEQAKKDIGQFYPLEEDGSIHVGYIWARTIPCQNPSCGAEIPLMRQFWLSKRKDKKIALYPYIEGQEVKFKVIGSRNEELPSDFDPSKGTVKRAIAFCPVCGSTADAKTIRKLFQSKKARQKMIAVVLYNPKKRGKSYRVANKDDEEIFRQVEEYLNDKVDDLRAKWDIEPIPDERIPLMSGTFNVPIYGMNKWGDLFNSRQKLSLLTFVEKVKEASHKMSEEGYSKKYIEAVLVYLALLVDRLADYNSNICMWHTSKELLAHTFGRQALPMVWDYMEINPFSESTGNWKDSLDYLLRVLKHISFVTSSNNSSEERKSYLASSTELPFPNDYFDTVLTDPPYYNSVPYADLSDFFYVWLKRVIGDLKPDLFSTPLTPKSKEIVEMSTWDAERYANKDKEFFESNLRKSFQEINRVLKQNGIVTIVYAHKTTLGWETLINSLLDSGLVVTASWPINTEMKTRLRAKESAALASSIYIVARKMEREPTGWFTEVKEEIKSYLNKKLDQLWKEGVSGADFLVAGIGSAIEVFGKYEKVMDYEGNLVRADKLLNYVREVVTDYTVRKILHDGIASELSPLTCFYILYRWSYQSAKIPFDEARKLAQSIGVNLEREWDKGFIDKKKEYIDLLPPNERKIGEIKNEELIDVLHKVLLYWENGEREKITETLKEAGYMKDSFFRVAQAISECLNGDSKEKKLLDGFLTGKERMMSEARSKDTNLGDFTE